LCEPFCDVTLQERAARAPLVDKLNGMLDRIFDHAVILAVVNDVHHDSRLIGWY
jgi:hypothetical protein